jgi:hypothetical protein
MCTSRDGSLVKRNTFYRGSTVLATSFQVGVQRRKYRTDWGKNTSLQWQLTHPKVVRRSQCHLSRALRPPLYSPIAAQQDRTALPITFILSFGSTDPIRNLLHFSPVFYGELHEKPLALTFTVAAYGGLFANANDPGTSAIAYGTIHTPRSVLVHVAINSIPLFQSALSTVYVIPSPRPKTTSIAFETWPSVESEMAIRGRWPFATHPTKICMEN